MILNNVILKSGFKSKGIQFKIIFSRLFKFLTCLAGTRGTGTASLPINMNRRIRQKY